MLNRCLISAILAEHTTVMHIYWMLVLITENESYTLKPAANSVRNETAAR